MEKSFWNNDSADWRQRSGRRTGKGLWLLRILKIACMVVGTCLFGMCLYFMKSFMAIVWFLGSLWAWTIAAWANWRLFPDGREAYRKRIGYAGLYWILSCRTSSIFGALLHHTCICDWIFIFDTLMWLLRKKSRTPCPHIETGVRLITQWSKAMRSYKVTVRVFKSNTPNWKRRLKSIFCFSNKGRPQGSIPTASPVKLDTVLP